MTKQQIELHEKEQSDRISKIENIFNVKYLRYDKNVQKFTFHRDGIATYLTISREWLNQLTL